LVYSKVSLKKMPELSNYLRILANYRGSWMVGSYPMAASKHSKYSQLLSASYSNTKVNSKSVPATIWIWPSP
jgi:hypothetical protein